MDGIFQILKSYITSPGKAIHVNEPLKRGLEILHTLCERMEFSLDHVVRAFLDELLVLVPLAGVLETKQFGELLHLPLTPAYDVSFESSLPHLLQRAAVLAKENKEHPWVSPWSDFLELGEAIWRHFRNLAENPRLAASQMMYFLIGSLQMIASVYLQQIRRARREHPDHAEEIERHLTWYLSFFWSSARNATAMNFQWSENATKCLGWIGLAALNEGLNETARCAVSNIVSVTKAAAEKVPNVESHQLAQLLMPLRLMAELATETHTAHMLRYIQSPTPSAPSPPGLSLLLGV